MRELGNYVVYGEAHLAQNCMTNVLTISLSM